MSKTLRSFLALVAIALGTANASAEQITVGTAKYNVVGENLVVNGSFDNGVDGWKTTSYGADAVASNFVLNTEGGFDGGAYITVSAAGKGAATSLMQSIAVEIGKTYYLACYTSGKSPDSGNLQYQGFWYATEEGDHENGKILTLAWGAATEWKLNETVFTAEQPYVNFRASWNSGTSFDGMRLVEVEEAGIDLTALNNEIATAQTQLATYEEGTEWYTSLSTAISVAQAATPTTVEEANAIVNDLKTAETAAESAYKKSFYATIEAGEYYIQNVESGLFLSNGAYWGTRSVLADQGIAYNISQGADGKYTLLSGIKGDTKALRPSDGFNDQSGAWEILPTEGGVLMFNGAQYFCNAEDQIPGFSTEVTAGCVWRMVTAAERKALLAEATAENPVDATVFITAPDFLNGDAKNSAWTLTGGNASQVGGENGSGSTIINNSNYQHWNSGASELSQTLTGLPNGIYTVSCQGFTRQSGTSAASADAYEDGSYTRAFLFAGEQTAELKNIFAEADTESRASFASVTSTAGNVYYIPNGQNTAAAKFNEGAYKTVLENVEVTDGTLKIGIKCEGCEWLVFDSFRLTYFGEVPVAEFPKDVTSAIVNADLSTTDAWNTEGTKGISGGAVKVGSESPFDFSQTIHLEAGQYKMTANAVYRYGDSEQSEFDAIQAGTETHLINLYATTATATYETAVMNRNDGALDTDPSIEGTVVVNEKFVPNSSNAVVAFFGLGQYTNELVFNVQEECDVKIGITRKGGVAGDYTNLGAWTLTMLSDTPEADPTPASDFTGNVILTPANESEFEDFETLKTLTLTFEGAKTVEIATPYLEEIEWAGSGVIAQIFNEDMDASYLASIEGYEIGGYSIEGNVVTINLEPNEELLETSEYAGGNVTGFIAGIFLVDGVTKVEYTLEEPLYFDYTGKEITPASDFTGNVILTPANESEFEDFETLKTLTLTFEGAKTVEIATPVEEEDWFNSGIIAQMFNEDMDVAYLASVEGFGIGSYSIEGNVVTINLEANEEMLGTEDYAGGNVTGFIAGIFLVDGAIKVEYTLEEPLYFDFTGTTPTAISAVAVEKSQVIYNLAGMRMNKIQKGINIINGKKVVK